MDYQIFLSYEWNAEDIANDIKEKITRLQRRLKVTGRWNVYSEKDKLTYGSNDYAYLQNALSKSKVFICFLNEKYLQSNACLKEISIANRLKKKIFIYYLERIKADRLQTVLALQQTNEFLTFKGYNDDSKLVGYNDNFKKLCNALIKYLEELNLDDINIEIPKMRLASRIVDVRPMRRSSSGGGFLCCGKKNSIDVLKNENEMYSIKNSIEKALKTYEELLVNVDTFKTIDDFDVDDYQKQKEINKDKPVNQTVANQSENTNKTNDKAAAPTANNGSSSVVISTTTSKGASTGAAKVTKTPTNAKDSKDKKSNSNDATQPAVVNIEDIKFNDFQTTSLKDELKKIEALEAEIKETLQRSKKEPEKTYSANEIKYPDSDKIMLMDLQKYCLDLKRYYVKMIFDKKSLITYQRVYEEHCEAWKQDVIQTIEEEKYLLEETLDVIADQKALYDDKEIQRIKTLLEERENHFNNVKKYGDINKLSNELNQKLEENLNEKKTVKKIIEDLTAELSKPSEKFDEKERQLKLSSKNESERLNAYLKKIDELNAAKKTLEAEKEELIKEQAEKQLNDDKEKPPESAVNDTALNDKIEKYTSNISTINRDLDTCNQKVNEIKKKLQDLLKDIETNAALKLKRQEQIKVFEDSKKRNQELNIIITKLTNDKKEFDTLIKKTKDYNDRQVEFLRMTMFIENLKILTDEYNRLNFEYKNVIKKIDYFKELKFLTYKVIVLTTRGKNTKPDGVVFIQLFGLLGQETAKIELSKENSASKSRAPFTTDDQDEFNVFLSDVEAIDHIRVFYYGKNLSSDSWQLDKIIIKTYPEVIFPVNRLLNKNFGDCRAQIELKPAVEPEKLKTDTTYEINVHIKSKYDSDDEVNLIVQLYGDKGRTTEMLFENLEQSNLAIEKETFYVKQFKNFNIGEITMLEVKCLNNQNIFISYITVKVMPYKLYKFNFNRWLGVEVADMKTSFLQYGTDEKPIALKKNSYNATVYVGEKRGSNYNSTIYIKLYGKKMITEKIPLTNKNEKIFSTRTSNLFTISGFDIDEIEKVKLYKDKKELNSGIFVEKLIVNDKEFNFNCWLHDSVGKRMLVLDSSKPDETREPLRVTYKLIINTGRKTNESSNDEFAIKLYGKEAATEKHALQYMFFENKTKEMILNDCYDVGEVECLELFYNHKNKNSWFVNKITLYVPSNNSQYEFPCECWFSRQNPSLKLKPSEKPVFKDSNTKYDIIVFINQKKFENTGGNICIEMYGDCGIVQVDSDIHNDKLSCNENENKFTVECFDIGAIQKIYTKLENENEVHCYLEKITISNEKNGTREFIFDRWMSNLIADKKTNLVSLYEADFDDKKELELRKTLYNLTLITKSYDLKDASKQNTENKVYMRIYGDYVNTEKLDITKNKNGQIFFNQPGWYYIQLSNYDVGTIKKIEIYFNDNDRSIVYFDTLYAAIANRKPSYRFDFSRIDSNKVKKLVLVEPTSLIGETDKLKYVITIDSDIKIESSDYRQFFVKINGTNGSLPRTELKMQDRRNVPENQYRFTIIHTNIGDIENILFTTHFNTLFNSTWHLNRLSIQIPELAFYREFFVDGGYILNNKTKDDKLNFTLKGSIYN